MEGWILANKKKKFYIAGPMTGIPQFNFPAFYLAATRLALFDKEHDFVSPAELDFEESRTAAELNATGDPVLYEDMTGETWGDLLARDVKLIADEVDGVVVLPGWETSRGARLEAFVASTASKPVYSFEAWDSGASDSIEDYPVPAEILTAAWGAVLDFKYTNPVMTGEVFIASGEIRTTSATGGEKGVKPERLDLVPPLFLEELGRVFGEGAKKYSDNNYLKGYEYRKSLGAMLRHIMRWSAGEDIDPETKCHHLAHAAWHCSTLFTFQGEGLGEDDRLFHTIKENR